MAKIRTSDYGPEGPCYWSVKFYISSEPYYLHEVTDKVKCKNVILIQISKFCENKKQQQQRIEQCKKDPFK